MKFLVISSFLVIGILLQRSGAASLPQGEVLTLHGNLTGGLISAKAAIQPFATTRHVVTKSGARVSSSTEGGPAQQDRIEIPRPSSDICQVRVDFVTFELAKPDVQGQCRDRLWITGATNLQQFAACGSNRLQHLYLHYGDARTIVANVIMYQQGSHFDLKFTFFGCSELPDDDFEGVVDAPEPAPSGCTQYYTDYTAEVRSFNYVKTSPATSQQTSNEKYTICVKDHYGITSIKWEHCGAFHISSSQDSYTSTTTAWYLDGQIPGRYRSPVQCKGDYIDVPGSEQGRYCGNGLPSGSITTIAKPFTLWVSFNELEQSASEWDYDNQGFCLKYTVE